MPSLNEYSKKDSDMGDPFNFSIPIKTNCPPSKMGIGNKFIRPKLILKIAKMVKKDTKPDFAAVPASKEICIGPPTLSADTDPDNILPIESRINFENLYVSVKPFTKAPPKLSLL